MVLAMSGVAGASDVAPTTTRPAEAPSEATASPTPDATAPAASDPAPASAPDASEDPPEDASEGASDSSAAEPASTTSQDATVDNSQTGVANTGVNDALGAGSVSSEPSRSAAEVGAPAASVVSGSATAVGGDSTDSISQQATAIATQAAHIVITQIALIVNIGLAVANSGANAAAAGAGGDGVSLIDTGDASVTGLAGSTAVTQVVSLLDAPDHTTQTAAVTNVGIGLGNTGANVATGQMSAVEPDGTAVAVSWGPGDDASIRTGSATAVGDLSHSTIVQVAMGTAADDGTLTITQRAVVVNFGASMANSGFDAAGASAPSETALLVRGIVLALLAMLQPSAPSTTVTASTAATLGSGDGSAAVSTGSAVAVGNASTTTIQQIATGSVTGTHQASADQTATVGNFGFAVANTGANGAGGSLPIGAAAQLASLPAAFNGFLELLAAPGDHADWSADLQLGADLLAASASVDAVQSLFDLPDTAEGAAAQVVVRQITGILNLMIGVAVSGQNEATTAAGSTTTTSLATTRAAVVDAASRAIVRTGDAHVVNLQTTTVCQVINVSASVCDPPEPSIPSTPVAPVAAAVEVAPASPAPAGATPAGAQLAFTGSGSIVAMLAAAVLALVVGGLLVVLARPRRRTASLR
jgi:hypothetical protein